MEFSIKFDSISSVILMSILHMHPQTMVMLKEIIATILLSHGTAKIMLIVEMTKPL